MSTIASAANLVQPSQVYHTKRPSLFATHRPWRRASSLGLFVTAETKCYRFLLLLTECQVTVMQDKDYLSRILVHVWKQTDGLERSSWDLHDHTPWADRGKTTGLRLCWRQHTGKVNSHRWPLVHLASEKQMTSHGNHQSKNRQQATIYYR